MEGTIIKRKNFGRQEERRSTSTLDTIKRSRIDKPTVKVATKETKEKPSVKSLQDLQKPESLSAEESLPKAAVKEDKHFSNSTNVTPLPGTPST